MLILSGRVSIKMAPVVRRIYDQMLEPKWAISMGACSSSGGMFANYAVVQGADKFMPVDIHVPGCPPRPEALLYGFNKLQKHDPRQPRPGLAPALQRRRAPRSGRAGARPTPAPEEREAYERGREPRRRARAADGGAGPDARRPGPRADRAGAQRRPRGRGPRHLPRARPGLPDRRPRAGPRRARAGCATRRARSTRSSSACTASTTCPAEPRFGVHYELLNMARVERLRVTRGARPTPASDELPELDSCVELFPTADFQEREVYDFFGIVFRGHPDLRRILMPEDYVGWPQRRDFPIGGEPVIFTAQRARDAAVVRVSRASTAGTRSPTTETLERDRATSRSIGTAAIERTAAEDARARAGADDDQHGPAPPGDPRGAAAGRLASRARSSAT